MAEVTVELGRLLDKTDFKLFDFSYPFDDANFKAQLEQQVIDYYYDYEIGFETPDMFKRKFKARWSRIMPHYNELYNTTLLKYDILKNYSLTEVLDQLATTNATQATDIAIGTTGKVTNTGTDTLSENSNGSNDSTSNTTTSDYPQQPIAGGDYAAGATSNTTNQNSDNHTDNTATTDSETNTTGSSTNRGTVTNDVTANTDYTKTVQGVTGITYPELIEKHRAALLRISDMIIEEMKKCFILVY